MGQYCGSMLATDDNKAIVITPYKKLPKNVTVYLGTVTLFFNAIPE